MKNNDNEKSILENVSIAAPCSADWNNMVGDDRERFCNQCSLNVYNISSMSKIEAEEFLSLRTQGRVCVQFYKRKDGTIITDNCPKGLKVIRDKTRYLLRASGAFLTLFATSNLFAWGQTKEPEEPMATRGKVMMKDNSNSPKKDPLIPSLGGAVYVPPAKNEAACFLESQKLLKEKIIKLESAKKDKLAIARAHLDLASFYRSKNHLKESDSEYAIAISLLSNLTDQKDLYKNAILNRIAVLKLLGNKKEVLKLEKTLSTVK